jgi:hypothetical protein
VVTSLLESAGVVSLQKVVKSNLKIDGNDNPVVDIPTAVFCRPIMRGGFYIALQVQLRGDWPRCCVRYLSAPKDV